MIDFEKKQDKKQKKIFLGIFVKLHPGLHPLLCSRYEGVDFVSPCFTKPIIVHPNSWPGIMRGKQTNPFLNLFQANTSAFGRVSLNRSASLPCPRPSLLIMGSCSSSSQEIAQKIKSRTIFGHINTFSYIPFLGWVWIVFAKSWK